MELYYSNYEADESDYFKQILFNINTKSYKSIGQGSSRSVYDMGNGKVVKAARNRKGIAQNEVEYRIASDDNFALFAKVRAVSAGFQFLIMDKAKDIEDMSFVWDFFYVNNNRELYQKLRKVSSKYNLLVQDFGRAVNWGQINGKPIIIDYGFTRQVRKRYYNTPRLGNQNQN